MAGFKITNVVDGNNPNINDLYLDATGNIVLETDEVQATLQRIRVGLQFFLGEWFVDLREGVPYYRDILIKNPSKLTVQAIIRNVIENTTGVQSLEALRYDLDRANRRLDLAFEAVLDIGEVITVGFGEFIVEIS